MGPNQPGRADFNQFLEGLTIGAPTQTPTPPPRLPSVAVHQILDTQMGSGMPVAAVRHPAHWQARSQVVWDMQRHSLPLRVFANLFDPTTGDWVEFFPATAFYWLEPNWGFGRPGQEDGGITLMPPMSAADAIVKWILPHYRAQGVTGLKIVNIQAVDPQRLRTPGSSAMQGVTQEAVCVRFEYSANGRNLEEEIYGLKTTNPGIPTYGAAGMIVQHNWGFDRLFSFGATKGRLEASRDTAWRIVSSVRMNPQWERLYSTILQQIVQQFNANLQAGYDQIAAAGALSRQISANNDALLHQMEQQRQAANLAEQQRRHSNQQTYTTADAFSDMIMGRDTYDDPYYPNGSQHGFHDEVWTDGQGNYEYRDNGDADPNVGSNRTWTLMQKRQVNG